MNDSDTVDVVRDSLATAKDSLAGVHVNTPLDVIVRNGRARRRRHRLAGLTGAMAVTAGMALAVTALASSGHPAVSQPLIARLAAWTVAKQANGDIKITIRELSDPSGLQSTLRTNRVEAEVRVHPPIPTGLAALSLPSASLYAEPFPPSEGRGFRKYLAGHSSLRPPRWRRRTDRV